MSGFQPEMFVRDLAEEFKCAICLLGLKEPVQTACGHRFCRYCMRGMIRLVVTLPSSSYVMFLVITLYLVRYTSETPKPICHWKAYEIF